MDTELQVKIKALTPKPTDLKTALAAGMPGAAPSPVVRASTENLDDLAQRFLSILYGYEPAWKERDLACCDEFNLSPAQRLLRYAAITLDQQAHLNILSGYEMDLGIKPGGVIAPMRGECPQCHQEFDRKAPGQVCCSNECGEKYFPPVKRKEPEYDDSFERALEEQLKHEIVEPDGVRLAAFPVSGAIR